MSEHHPGQETFSGTGWVQPDKEPATARLDFKKTIRIAVTGDVLLTAPEAAVIDTEDFQRLRGVRQLGTVNFVFPTALHTRFDHSLGTLARADDMVLAIAANAKSSEEERCISLTQRKLVRMYALLHDIPHVPFGHTIEDEMQLFTRHDQNPRRIERFLGPESEVAKILRESESPEFYRRLMAVYLWEDDPKTATTRTKDANWRSLATWFNMPHDDVLVHDIVSNTVCADLLDYVARDSYFCNLGISLEYRFINYLYLKQKNSKETTNRPAESTEDAKRRVFVRLWKDKEKRPRRDILTDLTGLMDARYMVAERAYFHHAKLITGAMLSRAIQEYDMTQDDESYLYKNSDDTLLKELSNWEKENDRINEAGPDALPLATLLGKRKLHRTVAVYGDAAFRGAEDAFHDAALKDEALRFLREKESRRDFENWLAAIIQRRPGSVLVHAPSKKMNVKVAQINVRWQGNDTTLEEIDDSVVQPRLATIKKAHASLWSIRLLATRDIEPDDIELVKEAFELTFLLPPKEGKARRLAHAKRIVERGIAGFDGGAEISPRRYRETIRNVRSRSWKRRAARMPNKSWMQPFLRPCRNSSFSSSEK